MKKHELNNIYKEILQKNLPRLLNLYNMDEASDTLGYGDRIFWGWKTVDFANGTFQGGVHSLSAAVKLNLLDSKETLKLIDKVVFAIEKIRNKNGSMVEAYANEHSFCVTALVAFDVLSAMYILDDLLEKKQRERYLEIVSPLIAFISKNNEEHAIISNHLATGAAAIFYWNYFTNLNNARGSELLEIIYRNQSNEGWYREYEGADPGYQTLCTYYLASILKINNNEQLRKSLAESANFLSNFIHPDGSIGGLYGSRNTEVYYPIVQLENLSDEFQKMSIHFERGITNCVHILPDAIDANNFIPLINAYAEAALYREANSRPELTEKAFFEDEGTKKFPECGIYIHSAKKYFAIINYKKGGTLKLFDKLSSKLAVEDGGLYGQKGNIKVSTQQFDNKIDFTDHKIISNLYHFNEEYPTPLKFVLLRILGLTVFRSVFIGNIFKKFIVELLMTGKKKAIGRIERNFRFEEDMVIIEEKVLEKISFTLTHIGKFKSIHMASSGYNQLLFIENIRFLKIIYIH